MDQTAAQNQRLVGLDLLRFIAIVLVMGRHAWPPPADLPAPFFGLITIWQRGGWIGVDLFFVLSGFLISGLLFSEYRGTGRIQAVRFYVRRAWKIYPPFYVLMVVTIVIVAVCRLPFGWAAQVAELLFFQNYIAGIWGHTWSLAVEEHFYFLLPLVLNAILFANRATTNPLRTVPWIAVGLSITCLAMRLATWQYCGDYQHITHLFPTHLRIDSLFFGVAISYFYHFHRDAFVRILFPWRHVLVLAGIVLLSPAFVFELESTPFIYTSGLTLFYIGSGALLTGFLLLKLPQNWVINSSAKLGMYSYSIYLWHLPVVWILPQVDSALGLSLGYLGLVGCYIFDSVVAGVVMARLIEFPALKLRDRLFR